MTTTPRREAALSRVLVIVTPDAEPVGYMVKGWHAGQQMIGPFVSLDLAIRAALANTDRLAEGQQRRHTRLASA